MSRSLNVQRLLDFIAKLESNGNYNAIYGNAAAKGDLSQHTLDRIIAIQTERIRAGAPSSAIGRYQFLRQTLQDLAKKLKLTGEEPFTPELQDRLATALLERRGLNKWLAGDMTDEDFANSLAMEWASLPVVTPLRGAHRQLKPGQSYYAGDDLNKALTTPERVMECLRDTWADNVQPQNVEEVERRMPMQKYNKLTAAVLAGAVVTLVASYVDMPQEAQGAAQTLITALLVWLVPNLEN